MTSTRSKCGLALILSCILLYHIVWCLPSIVVVPARQAMGPTQGWRVGVIQQAVFEDDIVSFDAAAGCASVITKRNTWYTCIPNSPMRFDPSNIVNSDDNQAVALPQFGSNFTTIYIDASSTIWALDAQGNVYSMATNPNDKWGFASGNNPDNLSNMNRANFSLSSDNTYLGLSHRTAYGNQVIAAATSTQGKFYIAAADTCLAGHAANVSSTPVMQPAALPLLSGVPVFDISEMRGIAIIDNVVWSWGHVNDTTGLSDVAAPCAAPFELDLSSFGNKTWTHVVAGAFNDGSGLFPRDVSIVLALDGTAILITNDTIQVEANLTALIRSSSTASSRSVISLAAQANSIYLLFDDGAVWLYIENGTTGTVNYLAIPVEISTSQTGLVRINLDNAVPANYKVTNISANPYWVSFLATPKDPRNTTIPPVGTAPSPSSHSVLMWGLHLPFERYNHKSILLNREVARFLPMDHLPASSSDFIKISRSVHLALLLGTNQTVYWMSFLGMGSPICNRQLSFVPMPVDPRLWTSRGAYPVDVAAASTSAHVLLSDGSILAWGGFFDLFIAQNITLPQVLPNVTYNDLPYASDPLRYARVVYFTSPLLPFVAIKPMQLIFLALDAQGLLYSFGAWNATDSIQMQMVVKPHYNLSSSFGAVMLFDSAPSLFWMVCRNSLNQYSLVQGLPQTTAPGSSLSDGYAFYQNIDLTGSSLVLSGVTQVLASETAVFFFSPTQGFYGYTANNASALLWLVSPNASAPAYPVPLLLTNVPPISSITSFTVNTPYFYILDKNGALWASGNDMFVFGDKTPTHVQRILEAYTFISLAHNLGGSFNNYAVVSPNVTYPSTPTSAPQVILLGAANNPFAFNSTSLVTSTEDIRVLPQGHTMASPTVANVSLGVLSVTLSDGIKNDGTKPTGAPRYLTWGSIIFSRQYNPTSFPSYLPSALVDDPSLVAVKSVNSEQLHLYSNCSLFGVTYYGGTGAPYGVPSNFVFNDTVSSNYSSQLVHTEYARLLVDGPAATVTVPGCTSVSGMECVDLNPYQSFEAAALLPGSYLCILWSSNATDKFAQLFLQARLLPSPTPISPTACESQFVADLAYCLNNGTLPTGTSGGTYFFEREMTDFEPLLATHPLEQIALGVQNGLLLHTDGNISAWGDNSRGQLGISPQLLNSSSTPTLMTSINSLFPSFIPIKVVATTRTHFALGNDSIIAWGDNAFGLLGAGLSRTSLWFSPTPVAVALPTGISIKDFQCSKFSCYVLFDSGDLYSWGSNAATQLGRSVGIDYDPMPALADLITSNMQVVDLFTSSSASAIFVRGMTFPAPAAPIAAPQIPSCSGQPPTSAFNCVNGIWTASGNVTIPSNNTQPTTINGPTEVSGGFLVTPNASVVFIPPLVNLTTTTPLLNVSGCFVNEGNLTILITNATWSQVAPSLSGSQVFLVESSCPMSSSLIPVTTPDDCRKTSATSNSVQVGNRYGLVAMFQVDDSLCLQGSAKTWWIVLVAVIGGVIVCVAGISITYAVWRKNTLNDTRLSKSRKRTP